MELKKFGKRMAKIKVILISLILLISFNKTYAYEISDLIKILIDKNENNSSFKYDDLIDDLDLKNANSIYIPEIDYSYDQIYKITFWERVAPLIKQFARDVAVRPETGLNYQINVDMMWFHRMDKGDYDNWHNHSYCQWVGVYYIDLPDGEQTLLQDHEGNIFQPMVSKGRLLIFPSSYIHKSPETTGRKTVINFNFNVSSKYTKETIDKVKKSHPSNYFDVDEGVKPYK